MINNVKITTNTTSYGLTIAEAKEHLNILDDSFDSIIDEYIKSAHKMLYNEANILPSGVLKGYLSTMSDFIVPYGPVSSVAVYYYDSDNVRTLLADTNYILVDGYYTLVEFIGTEPTAYDRAYPYEVEITTSANTDPMVKQCLRMIVADMFEDRQSNVIGASVNREVSRATKWQITQVSKRVDV